MKPRKRARRMLQEATILVGLAILAVKMISANKILSWASRPPKCVNRFADPDMPTLVGAAVGQALRRFPSQSLCLPAALAAQQMLRRRGIASAVRLGVLREGERLFAHAWVEVDGKAIAGLPQNAFPSLASFGLQTSGTAS